MSRETQKQAIIKLFFLLAFVCVLWNFNLQTHNVLAYQSDEATPSPTLDPTATPTPEESQPSPTATFDATPTDSPAETATSLPSSTPSVIADVYAAPMDIDSPPLPAPPGEYAPNEILVKFTESATEESILKCISSANATVSSSIEDLSVWVVQIPFGKVAESIAAISLCPEIRYAEPNYMTSIADTIPADPDWNLQYGLVNIRAPQGWDYSTGSAAVIIAIVDTGVDLSHPDLAAKIVPGHNSINVLSSPQDDNGHGTHAAGIAAASGNNGVGMAGVSWGARIMPVKVLYASGSGFSSDVAEGITWAADHGAQVINLSLGGALPSTALQDAVNYAYNKGIILVAAAGNTSSNFVLYPARYPNVIAVGAVDSANKRLSNSTIGPELDLVAPGAFIYSTVIGGYGYKNGTSMAAPYVSGLAAILRSVNSSPASITFQMESTALDLGTAGIDDSYGFGLIQMDAALKQAFPPPPTPAPPVIPALDRNLYSAIGVPTFIVNVTNTPFTTPTITATVLPPTIQPTASSTAEIPASPTPQKEEMQTQSISSWQLPCAGLIFVLAGLILLWAARQRR